MQPSLRGMSLFHLALQNLFIKMISTRRNDMKFEIIKYLGNFLIFIKSWNNNNALFTTISMTENFGSSASLLLTCRSLVSKGGQLPPRKSIWVKSTIRNVSRTKRTISGHAQPRAIAYKHLESSSPLRQVYELVEYSVQSFALSSVAIFVYQQ